MNVLTVIYICNNDIMLLPLRSESYFNGKYLLNVYAFFTIYYKQNNYGNILFCPPWNSTPHYDL